MVGDLEHTDNDGVFHLSADDVYHIERELPDGYTGFISWKLQFSAIPSIIFPSFLLCLLSSLLYFPSEISLNLFLVSDIMMVLRIGYVRYYILFLCCS